MSPAHVLEPTYDAIKHRLMVGTWRSGSRLEAARLAAELGVSITPVRDCLNLLAGERLVELRPGLGFHVPSPTEQDQRDLLDFNLSVLLSALDTHRTPFEVSTLVQADLASATSALFLAIAAVTANRETVTIIRSLNDRLHRFRRLDEALLPGAAREVADLRAAVASTEWQDIRDAIIRYHAVRKLEVGRYIRRVSGYSHT